ncbi:unnamed protein product [Blepharisma stoltei]|uniref:Uncharacterized protein n=1 Tax=Blepharisma stoltei TaxID=1481888 RepID=A0AAU9IYH3_9CILI|nr:unnamed protein product [Blepharisma stoltei]
MNTSVKVNDQEFISIPPNELTTQLFPNEREVFQCEGCSRIIPKARLSVHKCMQVKRKIDNVEFTQISIDKHKCELCWKEIPFIFIRIHAYSHYHNDENIGNEGEEVDERYKDMISNILKKRSQDELEKKAQKGNGNIKNEDGKENEKKNATIEIKESSKATENEKEKEKIKEVKTDAKKKDENNENSNTIAKIIAKKSCSKKWMASSLENDNENIVLNKSKKEQIDSSKVSNSSNKNQQSQIGNKKEIGNIETISLIDDIKTKKTSGKTEIISSRKIKEEKDIRKNPAGGENNAPLSKALMSNLNNEKVNKTNSANTSPLVAERAATIYREGTNEKKIKNPIPNKEFIGSMIKSLSKSELKEIYDDCFQGFGDKKDSAMETIRKVRITESKLNRLVYVQNRFFAAKVHHGFRKMHKNLMDFYV